MRVLIVISAICLITSCSTSLRRDLGLVREVPDEFKVISQPDLTIPPEFDLIPPQYPVDAYNFNINKPEVSEFAVNSFSESEKSFLNKLNLPIKNPDIRDVMLYEQKHIDYTKNAGMFNKLKGIARRENDKTEVVSPVEENKRIERNLKDNKPITEGEIASRKKEKTVWDKIFGK
ncbi:MAG: DUF3035 domain-containing protein [Sphingobacteriia bacterium]|nr:DUF3035 domain-containing protein [Sphingobacteriia bacterium]